MKDKHLGKYSGIDFSNHVLHKGGITMDHVTKDDSNIFGINSSIAVLKKPDTINQMIRYIVTNGTLIVTGDYGTWVFRKTLNPQYFKGHLSISYAAEKLPNNCDPSEYDGDATAHDIHEQIVKIDTGYWSDDVDHCIEYKEYLNRCLYFVSDELEYTNEAYRMYPSFLNTECVIFCKEYTQWFKIIIDGFNEINRRCILEKTK